jgi:hypothetical protein
MLTPNILASKSGLSLLLCYKTGVESEAFNTSRQDSLVSASLLSCLSFRATGSIIAGTRTQNSFRVVSFFLQFNLPKKQIRTLCHSSVLFSLRAAGSTLTGTRTLHKFFGITAFVPAISSSKKTILVLVTFFYCA